MTNRVIQTRKEQFDREIANYHGDDPLKLRYDFLLWLDSNFGKDKVIELFTSTLGETLDTHWNDARYKEDNRLVELQMIYATLQPDPLSIYQSYYERGVALHSSALYVNWANHLASTGDFVGADKIFKLGTEKSSSAMKTEVIKAFEQFLAVVGRKYLDGELPPKNDVQCKTQNVPPNTKAPASNDTQDFQNAVLEINPGKAGCYEDFQTVVAYFEPPDGKCIRMYPRDKVYKETNKEFSLEEIKAEEYFERTRRKKEQLQAQKLAEKKSIIGFEPPTFDAGSVNDKGAFPTPLLPCSGKEDSISAQSFTTRTKLAMHLVQDMWGSPTVEVQLPIVTKNDENKPKAAFPIYTDDNPETPKAAEKKPVTPFQVYNDSFDDRSKSTKNPVSLAKKPSTALKPKPNILSERKQRNEEIIEDQKGVKQQLHFETDSANGMLAHKLSETSVSDSKTPFQPFGGIKPLFPVEQGKDDFSDVTCNTKAFNFALPSSTPVQQRKSLAPYHSALQNNGSNVPQEERPSYMAQQNLSVIFEASKERCSSGSSTGSSQSRTPGYPVKKFQCSTLPKRRKSRKRNSRTRKSSVNVDEKLKKCGRPPRNGKTNKTKLPSHGTQKSQSNVLEEADFVMRDLTSVADGTRSKICCKTPVNRKETASGSASCPSLVFGPVSRTGMILRSGSYTPYLPTKECGPGSKRRVPSNVPKQQITEDFTDIDPFCPLMNDKLLALLNFPQPHHAEGYVPINSSLPSVTKNFRLGKETFITWGDLGKGAYARVVKGSIDNANYALKIEKPACKWEYYIAKEIQRRVDPKMVSAFMDIKTAYIFTNGSVLVTDWAKHGSLLNLINIYKQKTGRQFEQGLALHFAIEIIQTLDYLHECKIIHGDIKPDNFVVKALPTANQGQTSLVLIDFGRSIDMSLFPEGTKFSRIVTTEGFQCNEMKEKRPWTYQTDLYGVAGSIYCLLVAEYMKVVKKNDEWRLYRGLPRYVKKEPWEPIFHQLLNIPSCEQLPNLTEIQKLLKTAYDEITLHVKIQNFSQLSNIVMGK